MSDAGVRAPAAGAVEWDRLREAIVRGPIGDVTDMLSATPPQRLAHLARDLKALYEQISADQRDESRNVRDARTARIIIAALMCGPATARAAWWIGLRERTFTLSPSHDEGRELAGLICDVLVARQEPAWLAELAVRLTGALTTNLRWWMLFGLIKRLEAASGAPMPLTDGYVYAWLFDNPDLRAEPRLRELVARVFEVPNTGRFFHDRGPNPGALAELAAEGALDRDTMLDGCIARLLGGDAPISLRSFQQLHDALAPTPDEVSARLRSYLTMATSGVPVTTKVALTALRAADAQKPLATATLVELAADVFARPNASLATAQLSWISAAVERDPAAAPELLSTLTTAFGHPAVAVQQRAVRLAAKHFKPQKTTSKTVFGDDLRDRLREAAANLLDPALAPEAIAIFGAAPGEPETTAPETPSPPPYQPSPKPVPIDSVEELAEAFAPALMQDDVDAAHAERILEAVARFAHRDRSGFGAFAPLAARYRALGDNRLRGARRHVFGALALLFYTVLDGTPPPDDTPVEPDTWGSGVTKTVLLRIYELADALVAGRPTPCLLATPTEANGAIDPPAFLERLAAYQACDARPMRCDLEQALLRLPPNPGPAVRAALAEAGLPPLPDEMPDFAECFVRDDKGEISYDAYRSPMRLAKRRAAHVTVEADLEADKSAYYALIPRRARGEDSLGDGFGTLPVGDWPTLLPFHPDLVAAYAMNFFFDEAMDAMRAPTLFPQLAETAGAPGPITHLALAYGLSARTPGHRIAAVDALLILAARRLLEPALLGSHIGQMLRRAMLKPKRSIPALDDAARSGATREVVTVVAAAVAELADLPETRGLPELLLLAARYAGQVGEPPVAFPRLAELAAVPKPASVSREAARLRGVLEM